MKSSKLLIISGITLIWCHTLCLGQWQQEEFIIGAFWDPTVLFTNNAAHHANTANIADPLTAADVALLNTYADANFNLLTNTNGEGGFRTRDFNRYLLECVDLSNRNLQTLIHTTSMDNSVYNDANIDADILYFQSLAGLRQFMYGYFVCDEPETAEIAAAADVAQIINRVQTQDPNMLNYVNLFSNQQSDFTQSDGTYHPNDYRTYCERLINANGGILSFDHYGIVRVGGPGGTNFLHDNFYDNYAIASDVAHDNNVPFWSMIQSIEHVNWLTAANNDVREWPHGPGDLRIGLSEAIMRFEVSVALIYGATGIVWYEYVPECDGGICCASPAQCGFSGFNYCNEAFVNNAGNPTTATIYGWGQEINLELVNLGPTLMELDYIGTFHGSASNNMAALEITNTCNSSSCDNVNNHDFANNTTFEDGLPTIANPNTPVLASITSPGNINTAAIGVFEADNINYLIVMNKDLNTAQEYTVTLDESSPGTWQHGKTAENDWTRISGGTQFTLTIQPGDMELMRLGNPDITPILNLLLLD